LSAVTVFLPRKWSVNLAIGSCPRLNRRSSQSFFSSSEIEANRTSFSDETIAKSSPAFVLWYR
jgi:hypothetical protein